MRDKVWNLVIYDEAVMPYLKNVRSIKFCQNIKVIIFFKISKRINKKRLNPLYNGLKCLFFDTKAASCLG